MRALVTGASGFVGKLPRCRVAVGAMRSACRAAVRSDRRWRCRVDLLRRRIVARALERARPDVVFHLAAQSFVPESLRVAAGNVLDERDRHRAPRRAGAGLRSTRRRDSAIVLRKLGRGLRRARSRASCRCTNRWRLQPRNPYAASKAAAEAILLGEMRALRRRRRHRARLQSHRSGAETTAFRRRELRRGFGADRRGRRRPLLNVGNLDAERDLLDVRDVVQAYVALAQRGQGGEVYNVCSGRAIAIRELLRELIGIARVPVEVRDDPARMRPSEIRNLLRLQSRSSSSEPAGRRASPRAVVAGHLPRRA